MYLGGAVLGPVQLRELPAQIHVGHRHTVRAMRIQFRDELVFGRGEAVHVHLAFPGGHALTALVAVPHLGGVSPFADVLLVRGNKVGEEGDEGADREKPPGQQRTGGMEHVVGVWTSACSLLKQTNTSFGSRRRRRTTARVYETLNYDPTKPNTDRSAAMPERDLC